VVHVVRKSVVHAPRKTHAVLTTTVCSGQLRLAGTQQNIDKIYEVAGTGIATNDLAKVRVAGSSPVVRSRIFRRRPVSILITGTAVVAASEAPSVASFQEPTSIRRRRSRGRRNHRQTPDRLSRWSLALARRATRPCSPDRSGPDRVARRPPLPPRTWQVDPGHPRGGGSRWRT
jgi:hypothetical protein